MDSSSTSTMLIQQPANLGPLLGRRLPRREGMLHELSGRALKYLVEQIGNELTLCLIRRRSGLIDVRPRRVVASHEALVRHDLHQLEDGGVGALAPHRLGYLSY